MDALQHDRFKKELDTNLYRLIDSYRTLIKRSQITTTTVPLDDLLVESSSAAIVENVFCMIILSINRLSIAS